MSITIEKLRELGLTMLEAAKITLKSEGSFDPVIALVKDNALVNLPFPPAWMNDGKDKTALFNAANSMAKRTQADAVICLSDVWVLEFTEEQKRRIIEDKSYREGFERISRYEGVPQAAAAGYGELWEAIIINAQTPLIDLLFTQLYRRAPGGAFERFGPFRSIDSTSGGRLEGRMRFFDLPKSDAAH